MTNRVIDIIRSHDLTHEGTADQGSYGMAPYVSYNGSTNYSHRAAGALKGLNGFTAGGWFQMTSGDSLMGVWSAGANQCWRLFVNSSAPTLYVSSTGANSFSVAAANIVAGAWYLVVGRYTPSSELAIFLNNVKVTNTTSIPASLFDAAAEFSLGSNASGGEKLTGKASNCFMSHEPLADAQLTVLFEMGRRLYDI
jgi:hypothetical protein